MTRVKQEDRKRTRKPKVKSGCITCKIRHVKCDELKPACLKCTSTGRKCDGYSLEVEVVPWPGTSIKQLLLAAPKTSFCRNELEVRSLQYFQERTLVQIMSLAHTDFWSKRVLQVAHSDPGVGYALLALSNFHQHFAADGTLVPSVGYQHYQMALSGLTAGQSRGNALYMQLICCLLFVSIEALQGNYNAAINLFKSGRRLFYYAQYESAENKRICDELRPQFVSLDYQITALVFDVDPELPHKVFVEAATVRTPPFLKRIRSLEEAWESYALIKQCFLKELYDGSLDSTRHLNDLHRWQECFAAWVGSTMAHDADERHGRNLLEMDSIFFELVSGLLVGGEPEGSDGGGEAGGAEGAAEEKPCESKLVKDLKGWDDRYASMRRVVDYAAKVGGWQDDTPNTVPFFSLDSGIITPLYTIAAGCRDPLIRRKAIAVLNSANRQEGFWNSRCAARVAEEILRREEAGRCVRSAEDIPLDARVHILKIDIEGGGATAQLALSDQSTETIEVW